jgi:hypothetical protein
MQINYEMLLSGLALIFLGVLGGLMLFVPIPKDNAQSVTFVLGALAGAVTMAGGTKVAKALGGPDGTSGSNQGS